MYLVPSDEKEIHIIYILVFCFWRTLCTIDYIVKPKIETLLIISIWQKRHPLNLFWSILNIPFTYFFVMCRSLQYMCVCALPTIPLSLYLFLLMIPLGDQMLAMCAEHTILYDMSIWKVTQTTWDLVLDTLWCSLSTFFLVFFPCYILKAYHFLHSFPSI